MPGSGGAGAKEPGCFLSGLFAHLGTLASLVPPGSTIYWLADVLTEHMRQHRGFKLSFGGYHLRTIGFWLNGVYFDSCGLFLLNGERSRRWAPIWRSCGWPFRTLS